MKVEISKDILLKMDYLKAVVKEVGRQPLVGANSNVVYEVVWSIDYIDSVVSTVSDNNIKESLISCRDILNNFINTVNMSKINHYGEDCIQLLKYKYNDLSTRGVDGDTELSFRFSRLVKEMVVYLFLCAIFIPALMYIRDITTNDTLVSIYSAITAFVKGFILIILLVVLLDIVASLTYVVIYPARIIIPRRWISCVEDVTPRVYDRESRNIKWLDIMYNNKEYSNKAAELMNELVSSSDIDRFKVLIKVESLYMEFLEYKSTCVE